MIYDSLTQFLADSTGDMKERIVRLQQLRDSMENALIEIAAKGAVTEFQINDGMTVIKGVYNSVTAINGAIDLIDRRIIRLQNMINGRVTTIIDGKNMNNQYRW